MRERGGATLAHSAVTAGALSSLAYRYRVYVLLAAIVVVMAAIAPNFLTSHNLRNILKATGINLPAAAGFTIVMICGQLDLSVGACMTLGGMMVIGLQPSLGWAGSFCVALCCGTAVGLANGLLVAKTKINSFIVTLGTMIIVRNVIFIYAKSGTIPAKTLDLADWFQRPVVLGLTPQIIVPFVVMALLAALLARTPVGKGFYLLGGNQQTAWYSGLNVDRYVIGAFALSGVLSALGGAIVAMGEAGANPYLGENSLMLIVAAVIIGGTSMQGGRGSLAGSGVALMALAALTKGLDCRGAGHEVKLMASGLVLASVILYDAYTLYRREKKRGQRRDLLAEVPSLVARSSGSCDWRPEERRETEKDTVGRFSEPPSAETEEDTSMERKDHTLALACVGVAGCVAIVAIFAMFLHHSHQHVIQVAPGAAVEVPGAAAGSSRGSAGSPSADPEAIAAALKSDDGQPLIIMDQSPLNPPPRPPNPEALPEDDALRWCDMEYAGWKCDKINLPKSPKTGAKGKKVVCLRHMDHPYTTAYSRGMKKVADAYGIDLVTLTAGNADVNIQSQQVDQLINDKPDLVIIFPVDAKSVVPMLRRLNQAGVPTIASNLIPVDAGMPYILAWTGPDDWGQFRMLARDFAKRMNYEGGYCIIQHMPGGSPFFSRTFSVISELKKIAPKMKLLEKQTTMLEAEKSAQVVADWITKYGKDLNGIVSADDSGAQIGINEAIKNAKRADIIRVAAGNSKVGMDFVKAGSLHAITYQSAEADGALPMKLAADWFNGKEIAKPVYYLPKHVITKDDVDQYMPAQW
ncbi:MAG: substrate-binding domain-containing protein [Planctomycetota bacterium]|nr:substrate-binding domain-containing protein [Planctomycetota bacterium]